MQFEPNAGQVDEQVKFVSRGPGYTLYLTPTEAVLAMRPAAPHKHAAFDQASAKRGRRGSLDRSVAAERPPATLRMTLIGAAQQSQIVGEAELPGKANYFIGNNPDQWHVNIPTFAKVSYHEVYPGVDLVYYGNCRQLEYDFVVKENGDPSRIMLAFSGADHVETDGQGGLVAEVNGVALRWNKPFAYQETAAGRKEVPARFVKHGQKVGFEVAAYDARRPLVVDPALVYATYLGGSGLDFANGIALDSSGNAYVIGDTTSLNFPTAAAYKATPPSTNDVFVTKINPTGTALVYSTYLGGTADNFSGGIALDSSGNAFLTGRTFSTDFPTKNAAFSANSGYNDAFVTELASTGSSLVYSTYLGGGGDDAGLAIAIDNAGSAYVTGWTYSRGTGNSPFPTTHGFQTDNQGGNQGGQDAFVAKFNAGGALAYSTFLGGSTYEQGNGIAVDTNGYAYVVGWVNAGPTYVSGLPSSDFPSRFTPCNSFNGGTTNSAAGFFDGFLVKVNADGTGLFFSDFLGGSDDDVADGVTLDAAGRIYVVGECASPDMPTTPNAVQPANGGLIYGFSVPNAFIMVFQPTGCTNLYYSTYLGGSGGESGNLTYRFGIALDRFNNIYVVGNTASTDFPLTSGADITNSQAQSDMFVTKINPAVPGENGIIYSTLFSGDFSTNGPGAANYPAGIAANSQGDFYVAGTTGATNFPVTSGVFRSTNSGGFFDAVVGKFSSPRDLSVAMVPSIDPVIVGSNLTYTIYVNNNSALNPSYNFTSVTNIVQFATNAGIISVSSAAGSWSTSRTPNGTFVTFQLGTLTNNQSVISTITITNSAPGVFTNIANVFGIETASLEPNTDNNLAAVQSTVPGVANVRIPSVTASPNPVLLGGNLTYTIQVQNKGPWPATSLILTDALPASLTFVSASTTLGTTIWDTNVGIFYWTLDTMTNGGSATITIVTTPTFDGTVINVANVSAFELDPAPSDNTLTSTTTINPVADLGLGMSASANSVFVTSNLTYTLTVTNLGPSAANNTVLTDTLPPNVFIVSTTVSQGTYAQSSGIITCSFGTISNSSSASATITVSPTTAGTITNTASATSAATDTVPGNNAASVVTAVTAGADLSISQSASPTTTLVSSNVTFTITVSNRGPSTASSVMVSDPMPPGMSFVSSTLSAGATLTQSNGVLSCNLGTMTSGTRATNSWVLRAGLDGVQSNTVSVSSGIVDPVPGNNTSTVNFTINPNPNAPLLKITRSGTNVVLSWATNAVGYALQSTTDLSASGVWTTNGLVPRVAGNPGQWTVTNTIAGPTRFYRLNNSPLSMNLQLQGTNLILSWTAVAPPAGVLKTATNLVPPIQWKVVTNQAVLAGTTYYLTNPVRGSTAFFRLFY
jgi:uncharacterized repeat protein (TIGR01451 family)